jgi:hypothetical protein
MPIELEIRDGDPWWMSPDIWVVPGPNPEGVPGVPIAGTPAFLWARVRNNGNSAAVNATVRFYWADPSTGFDRNTATLVGTSFVSLDPGQVGDTLCLQPWMPEFVNGGHECVLAEAFHTPGDPLPAAPDFNVPTDRHVAQRNLSVVAGAANGFFRFSFSVFNTGRHPAVFDIRVAAGTDKQIKPMLATLGEAVKGLKLSGKLTKASFVEDPCADNGATGAPDKVRLSTEIAPMSKTHHTLVGVVTGGPAFIHIIQSQDERIVGGASVLVLPHDLKKED